jgi:hypothetical protein
MRNSKTGPGSISCTPTSAATAIPRQYPEVVGLRHRHELLELDAQLPKKDDGPRSVLVTASVESPREVPAEGPIPWGLFGRPTPSVQHPCGASRGACQAPRC